MRGTFFMIGAIGTLVFAVGCGMLTTNSASTLDETLNNPFSINLVGTSAVDAEQMPEVKTKGFVLNRSTKLAGLRVVLKRGIDTEPNRTVRLKLRQFLNDSDKMDLLLAHIEWMESVSAENLVRTAEESEQGPVLRWMQFVIDNWDQIKQIIEFLSGLFASSESVEIYQVPLDTMVLSTSVISTNLMLPIEFG